MTATRPISHRQPLYLTTRRSDRALAAIDSSEPAAVRQAQATLAALVATRDAAVRV